MARRRRKNPELFTAKNLLIAAGVGIGIWLVVRELRKRGILSGNGDSKKSSSYEVINPFKPTPRPVETRYSPQISYRLETATKIAPKQVGGPMYEVNRTVSEVKRYEAALPQARANITKATQEMQAALERLKKEKKGSPKAAQTIGKLFELDAKVKAAQAEYENSPFKKSLDYAYQQARRAAAQTAENRDALRKAYGEEKATEITKQLQGALLDSGEEGYVETTEGSVPRLP